MSCRRWKPEELWPRAELIAHLILEDTRITGVALTGSLARMEPLSHDIDLVCLHDGGLRDGSSQDPPTKEKPYTNDFPLSSVVGGKISRRLSQARGEVPMNYIFVNEAALWNCGYLHGLEAEEMSERGKKMPEFYLTVFCQIPLILLNPADSRGEIKKFIEELPIETVHDSFLPWTRMCYSGVLLKHNCDSPSCEPAQSWDERKAEIKRRKNHWWHR